MSEPVQFEDAVYELERIVDELERGRPALSLALERYEQGVKLIGQCQKLLDQAERSVTLLTGVDDAGQPITGPFDSAATTVDGRSG